MVSNLNILRIAVETKLGPATVRRVVRSVGPHEIRPSTFEAVRAAAEKLGIELPAEVLESGRARAT